MKERVLLCIVELTARSVWTPEDEANEMQELIESCGGQVMQTIFCKAMPPTASHLITKGKVEEIAALCALGNIDCVILSADLKGRQQRNLEEDFGVKTLDRTQVILDIFAKNASSLEGKMQVELAQLQYLLPRLVGSSDQLSRQGGGIGTSGPGETKLEVDRRRIGERITKLKKELKEVTQSRQIKRKKRKEFEIPTVALVGYTNAGKSTLLNALTDTNTKTHDGLFTTLDSLSRQVLLANNRKVVFSDTVGFMHDLPHGLIEAFKATLEEVQHADLLLHVIDISNPNFRNLYDAVNAVLVELNVLNKPILVVLNKIDRLDDLKRLREFKKITPNCIGISAAKGENIHSLLSLVEEMLSVDNIELDVVLPASRMDLVNLAHTQGQVHDVQFTAQGIRLKASLPSKTAGIITRAAN
jgi:GTPase